MLYGVSKKIVMSQYVMLSLLLSFSSTLLATERSNPWASSWGMQVDDGQSRVEPTSANLSPNTLPLAKPMWRFVTPEFLDSLKHQQMQLQSMGSRLTQPMRSNKSNVMPPRACTEQSAVLPVQPLSEAKVNVPEEAYWGSAGMPSWPTMPTSVGTYSMKDNLMYDTPAVSPWGKGADVLYQGESFPKAAPGALPHSLSGQFPGMAGTRSWVPNEALGGLLPMPVSSVGTNEYKMNKFDEVENFTERKKRVMNNVFNPFTFLPGDNLH